MCGPNIQNKSCICLRNVSNHACDICTSTAHDQCPEKQRGNKPIWITVVVLPSILILAIIVKCMGIYRVRHHKRKRKEQGKANISFCLDDCKDKENSHAPQKAEPIPLSELEYYETNSICSAFRLDDFSRRSHVSTRNSVNAECKQWKSLGILLARFRKGKSSKKPQNVPSFDKQCPDLETAHLQTVKRFPQSEILKPIQCLSYEEICKLNAPPDLTASHQTSQQKKLLKSTIRRETSSRSAADIPFACSESEHGRLDVTAGKKYMLEQPSLSEHTVRQEVNPPVKSPSLQTGLSAADQEETGKHLTSVVEEWVHILNLNLPFNSYVPVFEDIACLPSEFCHSDPEEMI